MPPRNRGRAKLVFLPLIIQNTPLPGGEWLVETLFPLLFGTELVLNP